MDGKRMKWKKRTPSVTKGVFTIERLVGAQVHLTLSSLVLFAGVKAVLLTLGADSGLGLETWTPGGGGLSLLAI